MPKHFTLAEKQPLAPGVTQKDVDLYKEIREKATLAVTNISGVTTTPVRQTINTTSLISPTSAAMAAQERCPAAIDFGPWDIETWYSSPFPQEYARLVHLLRKTILNVVISFILNINVKYLIRFFL